MRAAKCRVSGKDMVPNGGKVIVPGTQGLDENQALVVFGLGKYFGLYRLALWKTGQPPAKSSRNYLAESAVFTKLVYFWQFHLAYKNKAFWPNVHRAYREIAAGTVADPRLKGLPTSTERTQAPPVAALGFRTATRPTDGRRTGI
ncbi:MAG: hypothetical protein PHU46_14245 [Rhodocyclaceae bacterium]|nr:hypothetical protein [Rhodocyclaceae bacterium]